MENRARGHDCAIVSHVRLYGCIFHSMLLPRSQPLTTTTYLGQVSPDLGDEGGQCVTVHLGQSCRG